MHRRGVAVLALGVWVLAAAWAWGGNSSAAGDSKHRLRDALEVLSRVPTGRELLARAQAKWRLAAPFDLAKQLRWGDASRTDAVLTRRFNPATGKEERSRDVTIYLRKGGSLEDLVLDLAHELVHATSKPAWDPYDPELTAGRYIVQAIEGEGGEVDAVVAECRVGDEIEERFGAATTRCRGYGLGERGQVERERVRAEFYRVGKWKGELVKKLGSDSGALPQLTSDMPTLYSSTGHAPYPVALYEEFQDMTSVACENTLRRQHSFASGGAGRVPASSASEGGGMGVFLERRCHLPQSAPR